MSVVKRGLPSLFADQELSSESASFLGRERPGLNGGVVEVGGGAGEVAKFHMAAAA